MRSQSARDEQTITIATALAILVGLLLAGGLLVGLLNAVTEVPDRAQVVLALLVAVPAGLSALVYLIRNRRP